MKLNLYSKTETGINGFEQVVQHWLVLFFMPAAVLGTIRTHLGRQVVNHQSSSSLVEIELWAYLQSAKIPNLLGKYKKITFLKNG